MANRMLMSPSGSISNDQEGRATAEEGIGHIAISKPVLIRSMWKARMQNFYSLQSPLQFHCSPIMRAEPLKKKKRIDPALLREKAERKIRRFAKEIRRHEKVARKLKPIAELEVPKQITKDKGEPGMTRHRPAVTLSEEEEDYRAALCKEWSNYKRKQYIKEFNMINRVMAAQERALDELKMVSEELYEEALQVDPTLIPFQVTGLVETPPIKDYEHPEGEYINITKEYLPIVSSEPQKMKKLGGKK